MNRTNSVKVGSLGGGPFSSLLSTAENDLLVDLRVIDGEDHTSSHPTLFIPHVDQLTTWHDVYTFENEALTPPYTV